MPQPLPHPDRGSKAPSRAEARLRGYTLLEICLVLFIGVLIVGLALPSVSSTFKEGRLREPEQKLELYAKTGRRLAVSEGKPYVIEFSAGGFRLRPWTEERSDKAKANDPFSYRFPQGTGMKLARWPQETWLEPRDGDKPILWLFTPDGLCEPIRCRWTHGTSWVEAGFDPLTGNIEDETYAIR